MKRVQCIKELTIGAFYFQEGETYLASKINANYWMVDTVGIKTEAFGDHFEVIGEIPSKVKDDVNEGCTNKKIIDEEVEFKNFLEDFGIKKKDKDRKSLLEYIKEWWFKVIGEVA